MIVDLVAQPVGVHRCIVYEDTDARQMALADTQRLALCGQVVPVDENMIAPRAVDGDQHWPSLEAVTEMLIHVMVGNVWAGHPIPG